MQMKLVIAMDKTCHHLRSSERKTVETINKKAKNVATEFYQNGWEVRTYEKVIDLVTRYHLSVSDLQQTLLEDIPDSCTQDIPHSLKKVTPFCE